MRLALWLACQMHEHPPVVCPARGTVCPSAPCALACAPVPSRPLPRLMPTAKHANACLVEAEHSRYNHIEILVLFALNEHLCWASQEKEQPVRFDEENEECSWCLCKNMNLFHLIQNWHSSYHTFLVRTCISQHHTHHYATTLKKFRKRFILNVEQT